MMLVLGLVVLHHRDVHVRAHPRRRHRAGGAGGAGAHGAGAGQPAVRRLLGQRRDRGDRHHDPGRGPGPHRRAEPAGRVAAARVQGHGGAADPADLGHGRPDVGLHAEPVGDGAVPAGGLARVQPLGHRPVAAADAGGGGHRDGRWPDHDRQLAADAAQRPAGGGQRQPAVRAWPRSSRCRCSRRCRSGAVLLVAGLAYFRWRGPKLLGQGAEKGVAPSRTAELLRQRLRHRRRRLRTQRHRREPAGGHGGGRSRSAARRAADCWR